MSDFSNLNKSSKIDDTIYELYKDAITRINNTIINNTVIDRIIINDYIEWIPTHASFYYEHIINNIDTNNLYDTYTVMIFLCQEYIMRDSLDKLPFKLSYPTWLLANKLDMPFGLSYYTQTLSNYKLDTNGITNINKDILDDVYTICNIKPMYVMGNCEYQDMYIRSCVMVEYLGYKIYTYLLVLNSMTDQELYDFCYLLLNTLGKMENNCYKLYYPYCDSKYMKIETEKNNMNFPDYSLDCYNKNQSVYILIIAYILGIDIKQPYFLANYRFMPKHHRNIINNIHHYPTLETKIKKITNQNMRDKMNYLYKKCLNEFGYFVQIYINETDFDNIINHKISLISRKNKLSQYINKYSTDQLLFIGWLFLMLIYWIYHYWF